MRGREVVRGRGTDRGNDLEEGDPKFTCVHHTSQDESGEIEEKFT